MPLRKVSADAINRTPVPGLEGDGANERGTVLLLPNVKKSGIWNDMENDPW